MSTDVDKRRDTAPLSVRLDKDVVAALNIFASIQDRYVYDVLEEFIRKGLEGYGTAVSDLVKMSSSYQREKK